MAVAAPVALTQFHVATASRSGASGSSTGRVKGTRERSQFVGAAAIVADMAPAAVVSFKVAAAAAAEIVTLRPARGYSWHYHLLRWRLRRTTRL